MRAPNPHSAPLWETATFAFAGLTLVVAAFAEMVRVNLSQVGPLCREVGRAFGPEIIRFFVIALFICVYAVGMSLAVEVMA